MPAAWKNYTLPIAIAAAIVACLYTFSPNFRYASGPTASPYAGDFLQEWLGGWIVRAGDRQRFYDVEYAQRLQHNTALVGFAWNADEYLPIVYPPFYYLIISPLSYVSVHTAAWIWAALMTAALVGSLLLMLRRGFLYDGLPRLSNHVTSSGVDGLGRPSYIVWLIPAAVLFTPVLESLSSSQKGTLCLLILTATFVVWNRGRDFTAGLLFGLLAFKPQLLLVFTASALWRRQWKFLGGLATTGALLLGLSLCLGTDVCWQYVQFALGSGEYMQNVGYDLHKSHSLWGFAALLMPHADAGLRTCFSLLLAALVVHQLVRHRGTNSPSVRPTSHHFPMQFSALVIATVLLSPHLFTYDLTILLLPLGLLLFHRSALPSQLRREMSWAMGLLYVSPAISTAIAGAIGVQITVPLMFYLLSLTARCTAEAPDATCESARGELSLTGP